MLENKVAVIYGAAPTSIGGAVARAFAKAGARVFIAGRKQETLQKIVDEITSLGGIAEANTVDALNEMKVNEYVSSIVSKAGSLDISFNAINMQDVQGIPLTDMSVADYVRPINVATETQFLTSVAAARQMKKQGYGVILSITATPGGIGYPLVGGFGPACCAIESFSRNLASEVGPYGVRVVNMRSGGSLDSRPFIKAVENGGEEVREIIKGLANDTMLKQLPAVADIGNLALFLASDMANKITGVSIDITVGTTSALNYKSSTIPFK